MKYIKRLEDWRNHERKMEKEQRIKKKSIVAKQRVKQEPTTESRRKDRILSWTVGHCDNQTYPGLQWVNRRLGIFRTSWIHERAKNWRSYLAAHYRAWAKYKNHLKQKENRNFKAGFRTSLNSKVKSGEVKRVREPEIQTEKYWVYWKILEMERFCGDKENSKNNDDYKDGMNNDLPQPRALLLDETLPHFDEEFSNTAQTTVQMGRILNQSNSACAEKKTHKSDSLNKKRTSTSSNKVTKPKQKKEKKVKANKILVKDFLEGSTSLIPIPNSPDSSYLCRGASSPPRFPLDYGDLPTPPSQPSDVGFEKEGVPENVFHLPFEKQQMQLSSPENHSYPVLTDVDEMQKLNPQFCSLRVIPTPNVFDVYDPNGNNETSFYTPCFSSQMSPPIQVTDVLLEKKQHLWPQASPEYTSLETPPPQPWDTNENNLQRFNPAPLSPGLSITLGHYQDVFEPTSYHTKSKTKYSFPPLWEESSNAPLRQSFVTSQMPRQALPQQCNSFMAQHIPQTIEQDQIELPQHVMNYIEDLLQHNHITLDEMVMAVS